MTEGVLGQLVVVLVGLPAVPLLVQHLKWRQTDALCLFHMSHHLPHRGRLPWLSTGHVPRWYRAVPVPVQAKTALCLFSLAERVCYAEGSNESSPWVSALSRKSDQSFSMM